MKKLFILCCFLMIFSCGNIFNNEQYEVTYAFVKPDISDADKKTTANVIKKRLSEFVRNVEVVHNSKNEIIVKLKSSFKVEGLNKIVENKGKLDFWPCITNEKMISFLQEVDRINANDSVPKPLTSLIQGIVYDGFPFFSVQDTLRVRQLLNNDNTKVLYSNEYSDLKFLFEKPTENMVSLHGFISTKSGRAIVNESHINEVRQDYDQVGRPAISITLNEYGAHNWLKMTNEAYLNQTKIAIVLNDVVYSAPTVSGGPITGGKSQISGDFTLDEALNLSYILNSKQSIPQLKFVNMIKIENQ